MILTRPLLLAASSFLLRFTRLPLGRLVFRRAIASCVRLRERTLFFRRDALAMGKSVKCNSNVGSDNAAAAAAADIRRIRAMSLLHIPV